MSLSTESAAARGSALALLGFALTLISALVLAPGWARAVPAMHALVPASAAVSLGAPQGLIFRSGFEEGEDSCASAPDSDDDGLLDARCIEPFVPPDPAVVAPPINPTVVTDFIDANDFIGYGLDPIQRGLQPGLIQRYRAAVLRGRVLDEAGEPLPSVLVRVLDHPEYGYTYSRADGYYDLLVNGGGQKVLDFQRSDRLRAQRSVQTPWRDWALVDDLRLIPLDSLMTPVQLGPAAPAQFAAGSPVQDEDGSRQARVFFPAGTSASMTLPNGQQQPLPVMHFRATEYTVGEGGPERMPGELPPSSGYTYAVELSADQALAAGATRVDFSQPVGLYVDNFIGFPVGEIVPAGWYDFRSGSWVPSDNGRVIKILGTAGSLAQVDIDGSGQPASAEALAELGIGAEERAMLAQTYAVGSELWRTPLDHLTPWDCNWPYVPPDDVEPPTDPDFTDDPNGGDEEDDPRNRIDNPDDPEVEVDDLRDDPEQEPCEEGSTVYCQTQSLGMNLPVAGTPHGLSYRSDRTEAGTLQNRFALRLTSQSLPASLRRVSVEFQLLGKRFTRSPGLVPDGTGRRRFAQPRVEFDLTLTDAYERTGWQGELLYQFRVNYHYQPMFVRGNTEFQRAFARFSANPFASQVALRRGESDFALSRVWRPGSLPMSMTSQWNAKGLGLGGWMLSEIRALDPAALVLFYGDGGQRMVNASRPGVDAVTLQRSAPIAALQSGAPARTVRPSGAWVLRREAFLEDGLNWQILTEVLPGGEERELGRTCAGTPSLAGEFPSGCPAGSTPWPAAYSHHLDSRGNVWLVAPEGISRLRTDGRVELVALLAESQQGIPCDGYVSALASVGEQLYLACDQRVFVLDQGGHEHVAGGGTDAGEGVPALQAQLGQIHAMVADSNGDLLIATGHRIRRISAQGVVTTVAGNGQHGSTLEGGLALAQPLGWISGLSITDEGLLLYVDSDGSGTRVRRIDREGRIFTLMGGGSQSWESDDPDRVFARGLRFNSDLIPLPLPDGGVRVLDTLSSREITYGNTYADRAEQAVHLVPEIDGSAVLEFDARGRHMRTLHPHTGGALRSYHYNAEGLLERIDDAHDNTTHIARGPGQFSITSPWGVSSTYRLGGDGYLSRAELPEGQTWEFAGSNRGLYGSARTPNGPWKTYEWNPERRGRLSANVDATGERWETTPWSIPTRQARVGDRVSPEGRSSSASKQFNRWNGISTYRRTRDGTSSYTNRSTSGAFGQSDSQGRLIQGQRAFDPQLLLAEYTQSMNGMGAQVRARRTAQPIGSGALGSVDRTETVEVDGRISTRHYDSAQRRWTHRSPEGRETQVWLNLQGQPIRRSLPGLADIHYEYDDQGRLREVRAGSGAAARVTRMDYDSRGFLEWAEDPLQRRVTYQRDDLGRPESIRLPDNRQIGLGWDANGNLRQVTPPGRSAHEFDYTAANRLSAYRPPAAGAGSWNTAYPRDRDQELSSAARPDGRSLTIERHSGSSAARAVQWSGGRREINQWGGRVDSVVDSNGQRLEFGWQNEVLSRQTWTGPEVTGRVDYSYGSARRLTGLSIQDGASVAYGYDNDSLLTSATVGGQRLDLIRNAENGLLEGSGIGDLTDAWAHNLFAEPTAYSASFGSSTLFMASYGRDGMGRIETRSENAAGSSFADTYGYALSGRLDTVHRGGALVSDYGFDDNGNRTSHRIGPVSPLRGQSWPCLGALPAGGDVTVSGSYDAQDRMTAYGTCTYDYTRNGELTRRVDSATNSTTEYEYDEFGNLRRVVLPDTRVITYHIDGLNRRVGKSINGVRQWGLLYANQLEPVAELDADGNVVASFIYADRPHVPSLMLKGGQTYRIVADHLGSVRLVVNIATGAIAQRMTYDEYGNVVEDTNPGFQPFGYAGGVYDRDTGLVRFGARDYDAVAGRWTAKDPIRFGDGVNLYHYVAGQPINRIDIDGKRTIVVVNNASWYALGDHAGVFVDNNGSKRLYDPGGSYLPADLPMSNSNLFYEDEAILSRYIEFQMIDGGEVTAFVFDTSPEQEAEIAPRMEDSHIVSPGMCAAAVRNVLRGTGPFSNLGSGLRPDGLASDLDRLCKPEICSKVIFRK